ncbi:NUDIX domain-containing protein [Haloquadratum walsbyi]|jgi:ADP-ribose pyrophosphatase|uniref:ADP-ribose pyrophosphatase n=1 Tax=Haloquadratum walsbyi J07HQW2 TaxID=1238425 RepID=U1PSE4_9EURY|nr:NUDIX domain-containing protein [Haloquadratum walsbyi]ERG96722.1 MAG: ADP-ribose pyrophosphatase [Haloquadratum walsbyi J07HQW2]
METTRHFTTTVYIVEDDATALHRHEGLGIRIPPGGHIDRDELPHEAGLREVYEETGLNAELIHTSAAVDAPAGKALPHPRYQMLYDVTSHEDGTASHQHIDHVYYARVDSRSISPSEPDEAPSSAWEWYDKTDLTASDLDPDTIQLGHEAIDAAQTHD